MNFNNSHRLRRLMPMKKSMLFLFSLLCCIFSYSQTTQPDTTAAYWKNKNIPSFKLIAVKDSVYFTDSNLVKGKKTIFMLFNPECEHCQKQFKMLVNLPVVKESVQIVLTSTETWEKITAFSKKFETDKYPFVHLCKDYKYYFGGFFRPKTVPVLVFYNKQNQFVAISQGEATKKQMLEWLKD